MKKRKSRAFGKDVYLLGKDEYDDLVWLEHPSWDCNWYWGFGYVERYTNTKDPSKSKDITCHTHIDSEFKIEDVIDLNKGLVETTYTAEEGERLADLFNDFYYYKKKANAAHRKDEGKYNNINGILLPEIMNSILKIVYPGAELITSPIKKD